MLQETVVSSLYFCKQISYNVFKMILGEQKYYDRNNFIDRG